MYKIFPATLIDGSKVPLIKEWQEKATSDQEQIRLWSELFRERISFWGVKTGIENNLLVLDVDVKDVNGFDTLKSFDVPVTMTQRTPTGGAHYIFKYPNDGKHYGNKVKFLSGLDVRGEGGWIAHYGFDNTPIADAPAWLLAEIGKEVHPFIEGSAIKVSPEIAQAILVKSLDEIREAPPGEANNILNIEAFKVGQLVGAGSITEDHARSALLEAAKERGKSTYESLATINSAFKGSSNKPLTGPFTGEPKLIIDLPPPPITGRYTPCYFTEHDLFNTSKLKKPQLFQDWSTEDIHITTADGGTGKTTLKLYEAICLALGERFLGFNCLQQGKTLFITGEDTAPKLGAMIGAIARQMGIERGSEKLDVILSSIVVKKDSDLCIITKDRQNFLHPNQLAMNKILEAVYDIKPKLIVFDPISSFWGSEAGLNDMAKAVGKFMSQLVDESNACVEMINHMGKQSSSNKDMTQFAGRGGTGLPSNARVSRVLRGVFSEEYTELTGNMLEENQSALMCNVNKFTDGSPLYNKPFLVIRDGYGFSKQYFDTGKIKEEQEESDTERVFNFLKESQLAKKNPTRPVVIGHFMTSSNRMSEARVKRALDLLVYTGHLGENVKRCENPDVLNREHVYVIVDSEGKEI